MILRALVFFALVASAPAGAERLPAPDRASRPADPDSLSARVDRVVILSAAAGLGASLGNGIFLLLITTQPTEPNVLSVPIFGAAIGTGVGAAMVGLEVGSSSIHVGVATAANLVGLLTGALVGFSVAPDGDVAVITGAAGITGALLTTFAVGALQAVSEDVDLESPGLCGGPAGCCSGCS